MVIVISNLRDGRRRIVCSYFAFAGMISGHACHPPQCATWSKPRPCWRPGSLTKEKSVVKKSDPVLLSVVAPVGWFTRRYSRTI